MEIMCTKVSCCFACSYINWFIHCLISLVSFIVAIPKQLEDSLEQNICSIRLAFIQPQLDIIRSEGEITFSTLYMF